MGPSPLKQKFRPSSMGIAPSIPPHMAAEVAESVPLAGPSPVKLLSSPQRRIKLGGARRGITFTGTPKKKSPKKRAVRWRDDTDDGTLVEFQPTPKQFDSTPEDSSGSLMLPPPIPNISLGLEGGEQHSSPS